ncbi:MAG: proline--tRNA ligase [Rhodospirillales bacterium]|jgi:prolyl-tRNA synthetase|nr:proline--tRNA ligase [Rhodospirillales bacterium]HIJ42492.1 proline--tRNA ligase [Rhodospirillaceae bacterium]HIJ92580.1 proline--tRNA ligase [Rhodospirillaceae bacterium]HJP53986.1 proline--tRNA ligase [Rhodospirillales bacterium]
MRLSQYFLPTLKETPSEAKVVSHRLMLRAGMIRQSSAGIYSWLPLGLRVLRKIEQIVRAEQDAIGCQEMLMPTIQPADPWRESGRYDAYGPEMLRITDRHGRDMLYGPTNEEQITEIFRETVRSYKDLPKLLYHIQWKFRDEVRPRFGVMRGREFLMKDAYSFDLDTEGARRSYNKMFVSYLRTFGRMGLKAIPMRAESGPIGGDMSHEFVILADTGESEVACHKDFVDMDWAAADIDYEDDLQPVIDRFTAKYAATDDERNPDIEKSMAADLAVGRGIEVGHIFYFGDKYSRAMGATVTGPDGEEIAVEMGSYGIGVSRLVGAVIEASHDERGIIWPRPVAPFRVGLIDLKPDDAACAAACDGLYRKLWDRGIEVLYDDRAGRAGVKFAEMDLIGLPWQVVVGPRGLKTGGVELKNRRSGDREELSIDQTLAKLTES